MFAIGIFGLVLLPSIGTIQSARLQTRSVSLNLVGQNMATAMMELVKRSGYNEIAYGQSLPSILDTAQVPSVLLDFPRSAAPGLDTREPALPGGAPGGASAEAMALFLSSFREGRINPESPIVTNNTNYLFFSRDQVAAMNGYDRWEFVPVEEQESLLDPQFAWGLFVTDGDPAGVIAGGVPGSAVKRIAVVVKWNDLRTGRPGFTVLETFVAEVGPRL